MGIRYADISETGLYVEQEKTRARVLIAMTPDLADAIVRAKGLHRSVKALTATTATCAARSCLWRSPCPRVA